MTDTATTDIKQSSWTAAELAAATGGTWHGLPEAPIHVEPEFIAPGLLTPGLLNAELLHNTISVARIISNTRQIRPQDAFLALIGERFDAHNFAADAVKQGATAIIVSKLVENIDVPQLLVEDTRLALGRLGAARRASYSKLETVALTGSSGKTTTKEMIGSILRTASSNDEVLVTRGNLNNDLGVPMMLLELQSTHRYAVMELGANHRGEIAYTTAMVKPKVAGVLNIGTAHVGEFGGRAGIANAKSEIFQGLSEDGIAIIPAQGDFSEVISKAAQPFKRIRFGGDAQNSDVYATDIQLLPSSNRFVLNTAQGAVPVNLPLAGAHNIENALAATAFALALDIPLATIAEGLSLAPTTKGRLNFIKHTLSQNGLPDCTLTLIDDTYNANPHSIRAAAQVLCAQAGTRLLVLGDIGELGDSAAAEHRALGNDLASLPLDAVYAVGEFAGDLTADIQGTRIQAKAFTNKEALLAALKDWLTTQRQTHQTQINVLFKGSRFMQMETLITGLEAALTSPTAYTSTTHTAPHAGSETH